MTEVLFQVYLMLMAIISANQPSGKNGIHPEESKEVVQRMKERELMLHEYQLRLEKEIAELEARQQSLTWPLWELKRKIQGHTCTGFCLVFSALFMVWNKHRNEARREHRGEAGPNLWGEAWKIVVFLLTKLLGLFRAIIMRGTLRYLPLLVNRVVRLFRAICIIVGGTARYLLLFVDRVVRLFRAICIIVGGTARYLLLFVDRVVGLVRAICVTIGGTAGYLVNRVAELPLGLLRSHQRNLVLEIP